MKSHTAISTRLKMLLDVGLSASPWVLITSLGTVLTGFIGILARSLVGAERVVQMQGG